MLYIAYLKDMIIMMRGKDRKREYISYVRQCDTATLNMMTVKSVKS